MSNKRKRTYRVPKKVADRAAAALAAQGGVGPGSAREFLVAAALSSSAPVTTDVPDLMAQFFASDWRYDRRKKEQAALYGGEAGLRWANTISTTFANKEPDPSLDEEMTVDELFEITDEESEAIQEFFLALSPVVPDAAEALEKIAPDEAPEPEPEAKAELSAEAEELAVETEPTEATDPVDELGEHVETALGLATQLDETIEKLAEALDEALSEEEDEPADPEADDLEMSMVQGALEEVGATADAMDEDFAVMAAEARERVANATLAKRRSLAMAKMASVRMTLADEGAGAPAGDVIATDAPVSPNPKEPSAEPHHATRQVRDWHGRFAKAGARVRSKDGNLGYIKKVDDQGQLVVEDDAGKEHTVDPKSVEVVSKKSPARLTEPQPLVEDPGARVDSYLQWAQNQMGVGA